MISSPTMAVTRKVEYERYCVSLVTGHVSKLAPGERATSVCCFTVIGPLPKWLRDACRDRYEQEASVKLIEHARREGRR